MWVWRRTFNPELLITMKYVMIASLVLVASVVTSCTRSVPMVPPTTRTVVGPEGRTRGVTSWSGVTEQEGNAALGPLSNMRR